MPDTPPPRDPPGPRTRPPRLRWAWWLLAYVSLGVGIVGIFVPGLPTTVLVHGLDSSKQTWEGVLSELATLGLPAVAVDLRGHGESPHAGDFRPEALASDVIAATERLGLRPPFVLVGHSMGGRVAMRLAAMDASRTAAGDRCPCPIFTCVCPLSLEAN